MQPLPVNGPEPLLNEQALARPAVLRGAAAIDNKAQPIHRWAPWIAGFSASFVADAISAYLPERDRDLALVLDPFAGVGTTLVESLKAGANAVGYEINGFAALATRAKIDCVDVPVELFRAEIAAFREAMRVFEAEIDGPRAVGDEPGLVARLTDLRRHAPTQFRSRIPFFSTPVESKLLFALDRIAALPTSCQPLFRVALGATMVSFSNYTYEPSLSSRPGAGRALISNASVGAAVAGKLNDMLEDAAWAQDRYGAIWRTRQRTVHHASFLASRQPDRSVALIVTSPPYMNNYHYVRNTRPQLHWLGLVAAASDLRQIENASYGKFWQTVRQGPTIDLAFDFPELARAIASLRAQSPDKGAYGGAGWANYVATYANDSDRFLALIARQLAVGARAVVVVGNSIIQGMEFKVDELLAAMAEVHGLTVEEVRVVRTKRVGSSITGSSVRVGDADGARPRTRLYDAAVILRA